MGLRRRLTGGGLDLRLPGGERFGGIFLGVGEREGLRRPPFSTPVDGDSDGLGGCSRGEGGRSRGEEACRFLFDGRLGLGLRACAFFFESHFVLGRGDGEWPFLCVSSGDGLLPSSRELRL